MSFVLFCFLRKVSFGDINMPTLPPLLRDSIRRDRHVQLLSSNCLGVSDKGTGSSLDNYSAGGSWTALSSPWAAGLQAPVVILHQGRLCKHRPQPPDPSSHVRVLDSNSVCHSPISRAQYEAGQRELSKYVSGLLNVVSFM